MADFTEQTLPRRQFLRGHFLKALQTEQVKLQGSNAIRPPWTDLVNFYEKCTACDRCISACQSQMQILKRGAGGYPEVDFTLGRGECSFCHACVNVCEADVFRPITEPAWAHKIDIQNGCLALNGTECRSCEDSCEPRAIRFRRQLGGIAVPLLDLNACNGCGACLRVCPSGAISINKGQQCET